MFGKGHAFGLLLLSVCNSLILDPPALTSRASITFSHYTRTAIAMAATVRTSITTCAAAATCATTATEDVTTENATTENAINGGNVTIDNVTTDIADNAAIVTITMSSDDSSTQGSPSLTPSGRGVGLSAPRAHRRKDRLMERSGRRKALRSRMCM